MIASANPLIVDTLIADNNGAINLIVFSSSQRGGYHGCVIPGTCGSAEVHPISTTRDLGSNVCGTGSICP